jgi:uncharacterized protein
MGRDETEKYLEMIKLQQVLLMAIIPWYLSSCKQENMLFFPEKLSDNHKFSFDHEFEEYFIQVDKKVKLNALLFPVANSKGLVFYLHGNAGSLNSWATIAPVYLENDFDFFMLDYRGFGKSQGRITSEKQMYSDVQIVYDFVKTKYDESDIVIIGYSIGTGPAAQLASVNDPGLLILKAPFYNLPDVARRFFPFIPAPWIRYQFRTDQYITQVSCPVIIFHGDLDETIYTASSLKLEKLFKEEDRLFILQGQTHNGINDNIVYRNKLREILLKSKM